MKSSRRRLLTLLLLMGGVAATLRAQPQMPPAQVRFTEVRSHAVRSQVTLPGTVQARTASLVASEVAGLVSQLVVREGQTVRRGQPVVRLRQQTLELRLEESKAALKEATARLDQAERSRERSRELFDSGVISQQHLDDAISEAEAWEGRVERSKAELARLQDSLERSSIPAPFTGVVVREHVAVGEWLDVGGAVVELVSLSDLEIVSMLPGRYLTQVELGAAVSVTFEALPGVEISGEVSARIPRADAQSRTFPVKARIANPDGQIAIGMLGQVAFDAGAEQSALIVPKDAVVNQIAGARVFVIEDDVAQPVDVRTGRGLGDWIVVTGGLKAGQKVVVRGNERLRPGQKVNAELLEYPLP